VRDEYPYERDLRDAARGGGCAKLAGLRRLAVRWMVDRGVRVPDVRVDLVVGLRPLRAPPWSSTCGGSADAVRDAHTVSLNEARGRSRMAILNSNPDWPATRQVTILLSPADPA
jgi:hypothetical protein